MITINEKEKVLELLKNADYFHADVEEYRVGELRDYYFDKHSNLYEEMMDNIDDLEFHVDKVSIVRENNSYNRDSTLSDIFDVISSCSIEDIFGYDEIQEEIDLKNSGDDSEEYHDNLEDMTLGQVEEQYPDFYKRLIDEFDKITDDDIDIYDDGSTLFNCSYIEEQINTNTFDALAYWTIYFEPNVSEDSEIAQQVGLTPFEYDGTFYLALGGCGMDLSPKLDAYVALVTGFIPSDSKFFRDSSYFEYVVGSSVYKQIIKKCKLESPKCIINFSIKNLSV